jgi:hypothetical protein
MIAGYCGKSDALDDAFAKFVTSYARQTEDDDEALSQAKRTRRIKVAAKLNSQFVPPPTRYRMPFAKIWPLPTPVMAGHSRSRTASLPLAYGHGHPRLPR